MTEEEKIRIAAEKLYEAYGDGAAWKLYDGIIWNCEPEGFEFWDAVWWALVRWKDHGKPA